MEVASQYRRMVKKLNRAEFDVFGCGNGDFDEAISVEVVTSARVESPSFEFLKANSSAPRSRKRPPDRAREQIQPALGRSSVVFQHSTEPFTTLDFSALCTSAYFRLDEFIVESLMISFRVVVP